MRLKKPLSKLLTAVFLILKLLKKITLQNHQSGYAHRESRSLLPFFEPLGSSVVDHRNTIQYLLEIHEGLDSSASASARRAPCRCTCRSRPTSSSWRRVRPAYCDWRYRCCAISRTDRDDAHAPPVGRDDEAVGHVLRDQAHGHAPPGPASPPRAPPPHFLWSVAVIAKVGASRDETKTQCQALARLMTPSAALLGVCQQLLGGGAGG